MVLKYSFQGNQEKLGKAYGKDLPISFKHSVEISSYLRNKSVNRAKQILEDAINMKNPIPCKKFNKDMGHKKGKIMSGRYMVKASKYILKVLKNAEDNALKEGYKESDLMILHICANLASRSLHAGRRRGRLNKRTHVQIIVAPKSLDLKKNKKSKKNKKEVKKIEVKKQKTEKATKQKQNKNKEDKKDNK